MHNVDHIFA